jgi:hypothetical protein
MKALRQKSCRPLLDNPAEELAAFAKWEQQPAFGPDFRMTVRIFLKFTSGFTPRTIQCESEE